VVNTGSGAVSGRCRMHLRNCQEEMVLAVIPLVLEDHPGIEPDETLLHDVAAYVLNRLPPRYIMSERGLTRIAAEHWLFDPEDLPSPRGGEADPGLAGMVQLLILVNKALQVVQGRRKAKAPTAGRRRRSGKPAAEIDLTDDLWHNFPQIIGRVVDARRRSPVAGTKVTLSAGELGVLRTERGWSNPCVTSEGTDGYFSLWPRALRDGQESRDLTLRFTFEHPDFVPATRSYRYRSRGELVPGDELRLDQVINLGTQILRPLQGRGPKRGARASR
jgi:hypothetical protein